MELIADTTFLIGLWRNQAWAVSYAKANPSKSLGIPWVVLGEFWNGALRAGHAKERVEQFLAIGVTIADATSSIRTYAEICTRLQGAGKYRDIGQNDIWIATVALDHKLPLITRSARHFEAIEGLRLEIIG